MHTRTASSPELHEALPDAEAVRVRQAFAEIVHVPSLLEHIDERAHNVTALVHDIGRGKLDPAIFEITNIYGIVELRDSDEYKKAAYAALREYRKEDESYLELTDNSNPDTISEKVYGAGIVRDFRLIDNFINEEREGFNHKTEYRPYQNLIDLSQPVFPMIHPTKLLHFVSENEKKHPGCQGVQIEAILVKAAATFDSFRRALHANDETTLQSTLYDIEAFYAPLCEIIGYDAFVMAMRNETYKLRMIRAGETKQSMTPEQRIEKARSMLENYPTEMVKEIVGDVIHDYFLTAPDTENLTVNEVTNTSGHGIALGTGTVLTIPDLPDFDYLWRRKSEGSLAKKLEKEGNPVDIIGLTIITDSVEESMKIFNFIMDKTESSNVESVSPIYSQERDTAYSAAGSLEFTRMVQNGLTTQGPEVETRTRTNGYEAMKATILHHTTVEQPDGSLKLVETPIEIMIMTKDAHHAARVKDAAHVKKYLGGAHVLGTDQKYTDLENEDFDSTALEEINERRRSTEKLGLTKQGLVRAIEELRAASRIRPIQVGRAAAAGSARHASWVNPKSS